MPSSLSYGTFTLTRTWAASPTRVFSAWSDPHLKAQWFGGPPDRWTAVGRSLDFRTGGSEVLEGRFTDSGATTLFEAHYQLIEQDHRIVFAYNLHQSGIFSSVTLASLDLEPQSSQTQLTYTEQIVFLDGKDSTAERQQEAERQLAAIAKVLGLD